MSVQISPFILFFASVFTSNILLSNFLGMCSFISVSRDFKSSHGLGLAIIVVLTFTCMINWGIYHLVLEPLGLHYVRYIVFIVVIAAVVQILEMVIDRISPALYMTLGIFLPLITVNCAILGVSLLMQIRNYTFIQSIFWGAMAVVQGLDGGLRSFALRQSGRKQIKPLCLPD